MQEDLGPLYLGLFGKTNSHLSDPKVECHMRLEAAIFALPTSTSFTLIILACCEFTIKFPDKLSGLRLRHQAQMQCIWPRLKRFQGNNDQDK